ncbi:MAG: hypothetical protein P4L40_05885 [Terracidiphilus sp.]|nr:hypothetical protein [Terracidiphilus sp.]
MTFQVGLIGNGGIVLASDTRITIDGSIQEESEGSAAYIGESGRKIEFNQRIAVSCADDLLFARKVAKRIIAELTDADLLNEGAAHSAIDKIITEALSEKRKAQWLIAIKCAEWHLFKCRLSPIDPANPEGEWDKSCALRFDWQVAGHFANPAIFLSKYNDDFLSPEQLIPLAAHMVVSANFFNSQGIEGLDIVLCDAIGVQRLSMASIAALKQLSKNIDRNTSDILLGYEQKYTFAPNSTGGSL